MNGKILIVEDEPDISELIVFNVEQAGFKTITAGSGETAIKKTRTDKPDLIILDLMLPGIDGIDVCRLLKADTGTKEIPIIMLTARSEDSDIVQGLDTGADDYITKPFSPDVLTARIKSVLRRNRKESKNDDRITIFNEIKVDPVRHRVEADGKRIELTLTEFEILHMLIRNPGRVYSRDEIVDKVRGDNYPVTDRSVDVQIAGLRKKLGSAARYIETVRGIGYRCAES
ncbi:DNA-binding response regulator [candidate division KSB1 bacterium]|nr:MAG: DNA-binding response regulator [candidate division KSB1 bacterium]